MMNRRGFLGALTTMFVSTAATLHVPASVFPAPAARLVALEYLRRKYNEGGSLDRIPSKMFVGRELYEAAENEMMQVSRLYYYDPHDDVLHVRFKGAKLIADGRGWTVKRIEFE